MAQRGNVHGLTLFHGGGSGAPAWNARQKQSAAIFPQVEETLETEFGEFVRRGHWAMYPRRQTADG